MGGERSKTARYFARHVQELKGRGRLMAAGRMNRQTRRLIAQRGVPVDRRQAALAGSLPSVAGP